MISKSSTAEEDPEAMSSKLFGAPITHCSGANPDDAAEKARVKDSCTSTCLRDVDDNAVSECKVQMPSYIFMVVLDGYTFAKDLSWLRD